MLKVVSTETMPVTLTEAAEHLRIDSTTDGAMAIALGAACEYVQQVTRRAVSTTTWDLQLDQFPAGSDPIDLPMPPLQSVTSVSYTDLAGDTQTWDPNEYIVDTVWGRIYPRYGHYYPYLVSGLPGSVTVRFVSGYDIPDNPVPDSLKAAILLVTADLYENREGQTGYQTYTNATVDRLLWPYRVL